MRQHLGQFESLRGFAALVVYVGHILFVTGLSVSVVSLGGSAVDVFIILSGFVITLMRIRSAEPYGKYLFRRLMRLYPLFLVALLLGLLTSAYYVSVFGHNPWLSSEQTAPFLDRLIIERQHFWEHLVAHLVMLHGAVPENVLPLSALAFSGPLWSISLEWQFYLIAPVLVWLLDGAQRPTWLVPTATLVGIIALRVITARYWPKASVPAFLPQRLELFALGICCAIAWDRAQRTSPSQLSAALGAVSVALIFISKVKLLPLGVWMLVYWAAAIGMRTNLSRRINFLLNSQAARWLGERSFGLYVLHMPIVLAISHWLVVPNAMHLGQFGALAVLLSLSLPAALVMAALCYRIVEVPLIDWARKATRSGARHLKLEGAAGT